MSDNTTKSIPLRSEVPQKDCWNLSALYENEENWEKDLKALQEMIPGVSRFKGTLGKSKEDLKSCLDYLKEMDQLEERLGYYAFLRNTEDMGDSDGQGRLARFQATAAKAAGEKSFFDPELQTISDEEIQSWLNDDSFKDYRIMLKKILRFKPYILTEKEEKLLALQAESAQTAGNAFSALTNVDLNFGTIETPEGDQPLSQSTFASFLLNSDREIRKKAYNQFYQGFKDHENTLAALYNGQVQQSVYQARVRGHKSAIEKSLFPDQVPLEVYDNLIKTVHDNLPKLHKYYSLRKKLLGVKELRHYDVYTPLVPSIQVRHTYEEAVKTIMPALKPLGEEYCSTLEKGFMENWVDRFENKGKRSGAFSAGSFAGEPYILMNFKEDVLRDVFTLAHEGGHSMHSWYSVKSNPFSHYNYTIFEAEVASTFNEQLLAAKMIADSTDSSMKAYIIGKQVDDTIATIFRQTMFAEYERKTHQLVEEGQPLTVQSLRQVYRELLEKYFGPEMILEENSDLEGLRIPHFYTPFYVYKYATGLSAAIALAGRVQNGGAGEQAQYLNFLRSGGSRYPLESLKLAGVDMSTPEPIQSAMTIFETQVNQLSELVGK